MSILGLKKDVSEQKKLLAVCVCIAEVVDKKTAKGLEYKELILRDQGDILAVKVWQSEKVYTLLNDWEHKCCVVQALWSQSSYGIDVKNLQLSEPNSKQREQLLYDDSLLQAVYDAKRYIEQVIAEVKTIALQLLLQGAWLQYREQLATAAAAKKHHHAFRGGLIVHVADMMRQAKALCSSRPELAEDLLLAGIFFHDIGKIHENFYSQDSLVQQSSLGADLVGHIVLGSDIFNQCWQRYVVPKLTTNESLETMRWHLQHLILSHHGSLEFGSPICPKTPEAMALHMIDNMDAKLRMFNESYQQPAKDWSYPRSFPLGVAPVKPLVLASDKKVKSQDNALTAIEKNQSLFAFDGD